jgi:hypothetical protein
VHDVGLEIPVPGNLQKAPSEFLQPTFRYMPREN